MKFRKLIFTIILLIPTLTTFAQNTTPLSLECGDITDGELTIDHPVIEYTLQMRAGTEIELIVEPIGDGFNSYLRFLDSGGSVVLHVNSEVAGGTEEVTEYTLSSTNSILQVYGAEPNLNEVLQDSYIPGFYAGENYGAYVLYLGCTLPDGTRIPAGSTAEEPILSQIGIPDFGFIGLPSVDFSEGIPIPIQLGETESEGIGSDDVTLFTYEATPDSSINLTVSRLSGDISIGVAVIHQDTNQTIFIGGMPFSDNLSVQLNFPLDGTYVIGIFSLATAELPASSGAVEISIE